MILFSGGGGVSRWGNRIYRRLRARRALMLFNDAPLRTRRVLLLYKVNYNSSLLVLNGMSLNGANILLVLNL